jgi:hypothetical protein
LVLACPLGMGVMGGSGWAAGKLARGGRDE